MRRSGPRTAPPGRRRGLAIAASLLLHGTAILLYFAIPNSGRLGQPTSEDGIEVVLLPSTTAGLEQSQPQAAAPTPTQPPEQSAPADAAVPAPPAARAELPPPPPVPEPPVEAPQPATIPPLASLAEPQPPLPEPPPPEPPQPEPPQPVPPLASLVEPPTPEPPQPPPPPVPDPVPAQRQPPTVRLVTPDELAPPAPEFQLPPVPLPPSLPPPPQPSPPQPSRQASRPPPAPPRRTTPPGTAFPNPIDLDFGPGQRQAARPRPGRGIDLALGPVRPTQPSPASRSGTQADIRANVSPEWSALFRAWLEAHKYYPEQAARNGEDGSVTVRFEVDRDGRVSGLELASRSGSQWLDMGLLSMMRGARVPPLPPDTREERVPVQLTVHYILIRR